MRIFATLIFLWMIPISAYAGTPCDRSDAWSRIVTNDKEVAVKIWYDPQQDGKKSSLVYVWYVYFDGRIEGACVRLPSGDLSPKIYEWLRSGEPSLHSHARYLIEMYGMEQNLLKYAEPLGD